MTSQPKTPLTTHDDPFETTQWSLLLRTRGPDEDGRRALAELCNRYWYPVYTFIRRRVSDRDSVEDMTQGFFTHLLESNLLHASDSTKGKFRAFLVTCCRRYLANQHERAGALKRGGGRSLLSLDFGDADRRYQHQRGPQSGETPEKLFDRHWGLVVLERAAARLEAEYAADYQSHLLRRLLPHLLGRLDLHPYAAVAAETGMTEAAVKKAAQRLRERYRMILRAEVGATVGCAADIDDEIRELFAALAR